MRTVATAGHVDHGKSSLVLALTGTDPDRFPEEKARGLTIDLGFAFCTLASGTEVGFVDVPGHVRFIKNMLAGVGAVDLALVVVAATEGWMPQSEEHLRVLELLGVTRGLVVITKADLVDEETLDIAQLEIEDRLADSPLRGAPIVRCDSISGRGIDDVRAALDELLAGAPPPADTGCARLWVDRVFAAKGAGTVVTGTLTRGPLSVDEDVEVGSAPRRARVRTIETAGRRVTTVAPGARVALNLVGVDHDEIRRGDAVVTVGGWTRARVADVALEWVPGAKRRKRGRLQAYVGSGEHRVWFRELDGAGRFARLRFVGRVPLAIDDRVVLRDAGSSSTVAGAIVLDVDPSSKVRDAADALDLPRDARLLRIRPWATVADLARLGGWSEEHARTVAAAMVADGTVVAVASWLVAPEALARTRSEAATLVVAHHRERPHDAGMELAAIAGAVGLEPDQLRAAIAGSTELVVGQGTVRHASHTKASDSPEAIALVAALDASPFSPPSPSSIGAQDALVRPLVREGVLVDLDGVVFTSAALDAARAHIVDVLRTRGTVTVADVRDALGSTRKYVLPILGWLDRTGVTRRRGDDRIPGPTSGLEPAPGTASE
ncbi:MAG TPA: selenocysteine-specific translation elongation factor [Acidimicrobiia bacterium]|nr:selenocysteine-specific translation elongation factor [Acidimicrobiia bacterium]